jgi:putative Mg2+ transporter-C (MgtC) family protein
MDNFWLDIFPGLHDVTHVARVAIRLLAAVFLGGWVGFERESEGKEAGIRTHMLVALGAALFVLVPLEAGMTPADVSRVIQGVAAGIGFLGAGTILKQTEQHHVRGLTTAASIWITAAIGMAVGAGWIWPALVGVILTLFILFVLHYCEKWLKPKKASDSTNSSQSSVSNK